ncbi:unnamed protein product, partial [Tuber melanosporum]
MTNDREINADYM